MPCLQWNTSHAVWIEEIDDQHKEIFQAVAELEKALDGPEIGAALEELARASSYHFAHEERLMRAARYNGYAWHKREHDSAARRVKRFASEIERGDREAGGRLVEYLTTWLANHTAVADRMMASFLRNHGRAIGKITFRAGTKPADACEWVDATGRRFDPRCGGG